MSLQKIIWIYAFAFILVAFGFRAEAQDKGVTEAPAEKVEKPAKAEKTKAAKTKKADKKADQKDKKKGQTDVRLLRNQHGHLQNQTLRR